MRTSYHHISGQSLERLTALSDGIFAVAMTLLVLDLHTPVADAAARLSTPLLWTSQEREKELALLAALGQLAPHFLPSVMSFLTLGIFWIGQQAQLDRLVSSDRHLTWLHLVFLFAVSLLPFSTGLLAEFITYRIALGIYWLHLLLLGSVLFASWRYTQRAGLLKNEVTAEICSAIERRIVFYQGLYAIALLFCIFNTYISIALLILMQLNSAIEPPIRWLNRV